MKLLKRVKMLFALAALAAAALLTGGCGGINASKSISPLDFFLPGLHLKNVPPAPLVPETTNGAVYADSTLSNRGTR